MSVSVTFRKNRMTLSDPRHTTGETQPLHIRSQHFPCSEQGFLQDGAWKLASRRIGGIGHRAAGQRAGNARGGHAAAAIADQAGGSVALGLWRVGAARVELLVVLDEVGP